MLDQDEIDRQQQLLATHRRTLGYYLNQQAKLGGEAYTPPGVLHGIDEARAAIHQIKQTLRAQGVTVDDYADDESRNLLPRSTNSAEVQSPSRPLRVFLCHSSGDKPEAYRLYQRLRADGFEPWLDKEDLLPGQDWRKEIPKAVRAADVVLVCLSRGAIAKNGYVQQEIEFALDAAENQPAGAIYLIPLKLKPCTVPDRLSRWQWVDFFERDGYVRLTHALRFRARTLGLASQESIFQADTPSSDHLLPATLSPQSPFGTKPTPILSRLSRIPLSARGRVMAVAATALIVFSLVLLIALRSFNIRPSGTITNTATSKALSQVVSAPTTRSLASSVPTATVRPVSPTPHLTAIPTSLPTDLPTAAPVVVLPTAVVNTPTNPPPTDTTVPTPKPKPTANTQATTQAKINATAQARATADAQAAQIAAATQAAQATAAAAPPPTATPQPIAVRTDITNEIRNFRVIEETDDSFTAEIDYSYNGLHGDRASISLQCPAKEVRPGSICTTYVQNINNDFMTIGTGTEWQGMGYNVTPGDSFTTDSIEVCMEYEVGRGRYQTFLCRTFNYEKTWSK